MLLFVVRRFLTMLVTALCLTFLVFWLTNLPPQLAKLAKTEAGSRISDQEVTDWLEENGRELWVRTQKAVGPSVFSAVRTQKAVGAAGDSKPKGAASRKTSGSPAPLDLNAGF